MIDYDLMGEHQIVQDVLITPATELFGLLAEHNMVTKDDPAQFFIALDEVSNLLPKEDAEPTVLLAFLRVMRLLKALPMWSFILSTQRPLVHVAPATTKDSTARIRNKTFGRVSPFYSFLSGLHLLDANAAIIRGERSKAVACFSTVKHLARLGRPLWVHCFGLSGDHAIEFVEEKLFCGNFDPSSEVELFAFLSYRVAIDPCLNRVESASLEERTVSSHLRWVSSVRESSGMLHTVTLEEPIVSAAAASAASSSKTNIWIPIIQGMHDKLCSPGLIDRARTGELVLRCLVMMARDELFRRTQISSAVKLANAAHHISHSRPFKFTSFLRSLFGETFVNTILTMPAQMPKPQAEDPQITVSSRLGNGVCNFTHFASTEKALTSNTIDDLLHQLLYNQAALQLAANQKVWDVLIPIYFGDLDEPFDDSKISVLLIQVKNKENGTLLSVDEDRAAYKRLFKDRMVISILVDLGLKRAKCARQPTYRQQTWAYRITGHQAATYPCIPKELESIIASILHNAANPVSLYAKVSDFNDHWNHHSWNERCNTWGVLNVQLPAQGSASSDPEAMDTS